MCDVCNDRQNCNKEIDWMDNLYWIGERFILFLNLLPIIFTAPLEIFLRTKFYDFLKKVYTVKKNNVSYTNRKRDFRLPFWLPFKAREEPPARPAWPERKMICRKRKLPVSNHRFLLFREGNDMNGAYPAK